VPGLQAAPCQGEFAEIEPIRPPDSSVGDLETCVEVQPMPITC
jgi:hypothetical protein